MTVTALPIPVLVTRHRCPYCHRTHSKKTTAVAHMARCWKNPAARTCKGCAHFSPAYSATPDPSYPSPREIWEVDAACEADVDLPPFEQLPVKDCPKWEAR